MNPKTLIIMRHGKAGTACTDFERPLTEHGIHDVMKVSQQLKKELLVPDLILSSDAARTTQTSETFTRTTNCKAEILYDNMLYLAGVDSIIHVIKSIPADFSTLMLVGHNPGLAVLSYALAGNKQNMFSSFPTSTAAVFTYNAEEWLNLSPSSFKLKMIIAKDGITRV